MKVYYILEEFNEMAGENGEWETMSTVSSIEIGKQIIRMIKNGQVSDKDPEGMYRIVTDVERED